MGGGGIEAIIIQDSIKKKQQQPSVSNVFLSHFAKELSVKHSFTSFWAPIKKIGEDRDNLRLLQ